MNKGRKQELKKADEVDVLYNKRLYCCYSNRPKLVREVKRRLNKRMRVWRVEEED